MGDLFRVMPSSRLLLIARGQRSMLATVSSIYLSDQAFPFLVSSALAQRKKGVHVLSPGGLPFFCQSDVTSRKFLSKGSKVKLAGLALRVLIRRNVLLQEVNSEHLLPVLSFRME